MKLFRLLLAFILVVVSLPIPVSAQNNRGVMTAASANCSTADSCVILDLATSSLGGAFQLLGTFTATVQFEATTNGATWAGLPVSPIAGGAAVTSATAAGIWTFPTGGFSRVRARVSAYTSGGIETIILASGSSAGGATSVSGTVSVDVVGNTIGLATESTLAGMSHTQASTTSGQEGVLILGATATSSPTDTNGQTNPLSLTLDRLLRVAAQGMSGDGEAVAGDPVRIAGKDGSGNTQDIATDTSGNITLSPTTYNTYANRPTYTQGNSATQYEITSDGALMIYGAVTVPTMISTLNATVQTILSGPGVLDNIYCTNTDATNWAYIQFFNTTGAVTPGTTVPTNFIGVPPNGGSGPSERRWIYSTGLKVIATTTPTGSTNAVTALQCTAGVRG